MNRKPFGKKCSCDHFESEHLVKRTISSNSSLSHDLQFLLPHAPSLDEPIRTNCKLCKCKKFNPSKKGWSAFQ